MGLYAVFMGGEPAVFRAASLGGLALFAAQIGRRQASLNSLGLAALVMMLLADSGYGPSNPPEWLRALSSQLELLSVAADGYQSRPDPAVLKVLAGRNLLRTGRNGWVEVTTDGEQMRVQVERR